MSVSCPAKRRAFLHGQRTVIPGSALASRPGMTGVRRGHDAGDEICFNASPDAFCPDPHMSSITLRTALPADRDAVIELIHQLNVFEADLVGDRRRDYAAAAEYYDELMQRLA